MRNILLLAALTIFAGCSSSTKKSTKFPTGDSPELMPGGQVAVMEVPMYQNIIGGKLYFKDSEETWPAAGMRIFLMRENIEVARTKVFSNGLFRFSGDFGPGVYEIRRELNGREAGRDHVSVANINFQGVDQPDLRIVIRK